MTEEELEKFTVDFMNNETGTNWSRIDSIMGKMLIKYAEVFQKRIEDLEKENAELKNGYGMCYRKDKEQLTKAKEIIRTFLGFAEAFGYSPSMDKFITEAEQFLSEVEK